MKFKPMFNNYKVQITHFLVLIIIFSSCQVFVHSNEIINANNYLISKLKTEDPKDTFYLYLNPNYFSEKLHFNSIATIKTNPIASEIIINNSDRIEVIYLYTQTKALDNIISNDEITPLLFLNNKFMGKGWKMRDSVEQNSKK